MKVRLTRFSGNDWRACEEMKEWNHENLKGADA